MLTIDLNDMPRKDLGEALAEIIEARAAGKKLVRQEPWDWAVAELKRRGGDIADVVWDDGRTEELGIDISVPPIQFTIDQHTSPEECENLYHRNVGIRNRARAEKFFKGIPPEKIHWADGKLSLRIMDESPPAPWEIRQRQEDIWCYGNQACFYGSVLLPGETLPPLSLEQSENNMVIWIGKERGLAIAQALRDLGIQYDGCVNLPPRVQKAR